MQWFQESEQKNLYDILIGHEPAVAENKVEITLDSSVEKEFIDKNSALIQGYFKRHFKNFEGLILKIKEGASPKKIILNDFDRLKILQEKSPLLKKLINDLDLEMLR